MFFYRVELSGYESYDPRVLCHENEMTEDEFNSLIDRIVLRVVPAAIQREFEAEKGMYESNIKDSIEREVMITKRFGSVANYREYIMNEASKPTDLTWQSIFDAVVDILISEYNFSYLKYTAIVDKFERDVIGVVPPVLPGH